MAGNGKNIKAPKPRLSDLRLASAIGGAIQETLGPQIEGLREEVHGLRDEMHTGFAGVNQRLDQLTKGAVGVGRMSALENTVAELRNDVDELKRRRTQGPT